MIMQWVDDETMDYYKCNGLTIMQRVINNAMGQKPILNT